MLNKIHFLIIRHKPNVLAFQPYFYDDCGANKNCLKLYNFEASLPKPWNSRVSTFSSGGLQLKTSTGEGANSS